MVYYSVIYVFLAMMKKLFVSSRSLWVMLLFSLAVNSAGAQVSVKDSAISMVMIRPSYGIQLPGADLANRFGFNQTVGLATTYKNKLGWMISAEGDFIFGNRITEPNLFSMLTTTEGTIIGEDGLYGDIRVFERGYYITLSFGRLFKVLKPNPNCGFIVEGGVGFFQHKIKIQDKKNSVPSLNGDYVKGYDHLTNGLSVREFIGYQYISNHRLVNFYGGVEFLQGFTKNRRDYNYSEMSADPSTRFDMLMGIRVGWIIPLFKEAPEEFYMY